MASNRREYDEEAGAGFYRNREKSGRKACRACTDFQTWVKNRPSGKNEDKAPNVADSECPMDREELGRNTWSFLHTMAAYYPKRPSEQQQRNMTEFMHLFSQFYPCKDCAKDLRENLANNKPDVKDRYTFSDWMCRMHNDVNKKLGKPEFDCSLVLERWRTGWKDGSCD